MTKGSLCGHLEQPTIVCVFALTIHVAVRPFRNAIVNILQTILQICVLLLSALNIPAGVLASSATSYNVLGDTFVNGIDIMYSILLMLPMVVAVVCRMVLTSSQCTGSECWCVKKLVWLQYDSRCIRMKKGNGGDIAGSRGVGMNDDSMRVGVAGRRVGIAAREPHDDNANGNGSGSDVHPPAEVLGGRLLLSDDSKYF